MARLLSLLSLMLLLGIGAASAGPKAYRTVTVAKAWCIPGAWRSCPMGACW